MSTQSNEGFISGVTNSIAEIHRLIPDSILFGSLLLYFLTHNLSFGIFAIFIFEMVLSHKLISWTSSQAVGPSSRSADIKCRPGYKTPQFAAERMFSHDTYPSYGIFSIVSIATYLGLATNEFSQTLDTMGSEWSSRKYVAYGFAVTLCLIFIIMRFVVCKDGAGEIITAIVSALIIGFIFFAVNKKLFGVEGINFLGLPTLVSKETEGSPIYVCSAEKDE